MNGCWNRRGDRERERGEGRSDFASPFFLTRLEAVVKKKRFFSQVATNVVRHTKYIETFDSEYFFMF